MLSKRQRKWVLIILVMILCLVFIRGFRIIINDNDNEHIGVIVEFDQEMVYLSNLPDIYAGKKIAKKYGSIIVPNTRTWTSSIEYFPEIKLDEIGCAEQFTIVGAFSRIPVGLLESAFSGGTTKFLEVSSNEHPLTIIHKEIYDYYARESASSVNSKAHADLIVDTGPGKTNSSGGAGLSSDQGQAGQFTTTNSYIVKNVEGWFGKIKEGTVTAAIYTDDGSGIPVSELYSQEFLLDRPSSRNQTWDGAYGLSWALDPGTYWLAFEVRLGNTASGFMPSSKDGAPNPLVDHAYWNGLNWSHIFSDPAYGMRICAAPITPAL